MKHGSGPEGEHLHSTSSISPCSPGMPQLWEVSMANKGTPMHTNNYMNNFGHWYPNPHPDTMSRPQMMWVDNLVSVQASANYRYSHGREVRQLYTRMHIMQQVWIVCWRVFKYELCFYSLYAIYVFGPCYRPYVQHIICLFSESLTSFIGECYNIEATTLWVYIKCAILIGIVYVMCSPSFRLRCYDRVGLSTAGVPRHNLTVCHITDSCLCKYVK